jgi:pyrroline-5-carboxylate reductase
VTAARRRILLVGCGKMGQALGRGWLARGQNPAGLMAIEPNDATARAAKDAGIPTVRALGQLDTAFQPDWVVLAVKPQVAASSLTDYARFDQPAKFVSIIAGTRISALRTYLGPKAAVVRAMPNTAAAVGRGMTVAIAGPGVTTAARTECTALLEAVGDVAWVEDEALMDAVTAVSGSGPAYVFLLIECLAEAGVRAGLAPPLAHRLARQTIVGAGELARVSPETAQVLRQNVTSPGGTTEAALKVLMGEGGLQRLLTEAVAAAASRSRKLAG